MNFQDLKKIEKADFYIDLAFRRATERGDIMRSSLAGKPSNRLEKSKTIELEKIATIRLTFAECLDRIIKNFPCCLR